ncbi:MAG: hypothetical protein KDA57_08025 [Planctomycetales bacterium]|nr:hypothetical protein [Planctomycetales bacterium]
MLRIGWLLAWGSAGIPAIFLNPNETPLLVKVPAAGAEVEVSLTSSGAVSTVNVKQLPEFGP